MNDDDDFFDYLIMLSVGFIVLLLFGATVMMILNFLGV